MDRVLSPYELAWRRAAGHEPPAEVPLSTTVEIVEHPDGAHAQVQTITLDGTPAGLIDLGVIEPAPTAATEAPPLVEPPGLTLTFVSSNIRGAAFDAATGVLEVEFVSGKRYRYANFTPELLTQWRGAKSAGAWFNATVKVRPDLFPPIPTTPSSGGK